MNRQSDKILISGIDCVAAIGVAPEERTIKQRLLIDVEFSTDARKPARRDSLKDAMDYAKVVSDVVEVARSRDFHLIETLAERISERILSNVPTSEVRVLVRKLTPVLEHRVAHVAVEIVRKRHGAPP